VATDDKKAQNQPRSKTEAAPEKKSVSSAEPSKSESAKYVPCPPAIAGAKVRNRFPRLIGITGT
jgi:hypothetical protein